MKTFMKYFAVIAFIGLMATNASAQNVSNFSEQGGSRWVVGGSVDVISGGDIDIESGGALKIAGTTMSASAAELNIMDGVTSTTAELNILDGVTSTSTEINLLDGTVVGNTVASKVPLLDSAKALQTNANVGTAGTGVTAVEYGNGYDHVTVLTMTAAALTPTIPADAEGAGVIIYTFPAGVHIVTACHMDVTAFTADSATNAVDMGIGSLIASGDITTLSTAAMEDCVTGQTVADISSPATEKSTIMTAGAPLLFESSGSKVIHLNVAGTWNNTVATADVTGTVTIYWTFLGA